MGCGSSKEKAPAKEVSAASPPDPEPAAASPDPEKTPEGKESGETEEGARRMSQIVLQQNFQEFKVVISKLADFVGEKDGKRHVQLLNHEAVHGKAWKKLVAEKRKMSHHGHERSPYAEQFAVPIVERAREMAALVAEEKDMLHAKWSRYKCPLSQLLLGKDEDDPKRTCDSMTELCKEMVEHCEKDSTVNDAKLPAKVFGDLHGHFRDLLLFLHHYGFPAHDGPDFVFNGDWVDRGAHQLETLCLVYALKLAFPDQVHLNRGNHEDASINKHMGSTGLTHVVEMKFGKQIGHEMSKKIVHSFEMLPICTVIGGKVFVVHGGIGDGKWDVQQVRETKRPLTSKDIPKHPIVYNCLWSDPIDEDQKKSFGVHSSPRDDHRGIMKMFGQDVTESFLKRNGLDMVIRSHEAAVEGEGYEVMHNSKLMRVFSARDYEGEDNDGALLTLDVVPEQSEVVVRPQVLHSLIKHK